MRRSGHLLLLVLLLITMFSQHGQSQDFAPSDASARFLTDAVCDSVLLSSFKAYGSTQGLTEADIRARYSVMRGSLMGLVRATLAAPVLALDRRYGQVDPGSALAPKAREAYLAALRESADRLLETPQSLYPLFEINHSDRILLFQSELDVQANGKIQVRETIRIYNGNGQTQAPVLDAAMASTNNDIQRGIVRDFPTRYIDRNGYWSVTGFRLRGITVNGQSESHVEEQLSNGTRIKIGKAEAFLPEGVFTYVIEYETDRQLIFHPDKDEIYWNVNGNGWVFTADTVQCIIRFPEGARITESACYTGPMGSTERDCQARQEGDREIRFSASCRLEAYEGLTVAAAIDKGVLAAPGKAGSIWAFLRANFILPFLSAILAFLSIFFTVSWFRKGRDPEQQTIIPQFEPPAGLGPAETGYLLRQGYDSKLFAATLVDAAVRRDLDIQVDKEGKWFKSTVYSFHRPVEGGKGNTSGSVDRYGISIGQLYGQEAERGKYNPTIKSLNTQLQTWLKDRMQLKKQKGGGVRGYFALNRGYAAVGVVFMLLAFVVSMFYTAMYYTPKVFTLTVILFLACLAVTIVFSILMKAYTPEGRKLTDHILGFRQYLDMAEQDMYQQLTPPEKTLELFERYLPYAIALNVENHWAEKFDGLIQQAVAGGYQPAYFRGSMFSMGNFSASSFSSGISSGLSSTISSASTPPSSSGGGSGGGGSSGGGGGGGGGGGW